MLKNGKYPIGFWNYSDIDNPRACDVQDWADAGMTIAHTPRYVAGEGNKGKMLALLDEAEKHDIGCIVCDERLATWWPDKYDESEFRGHLQAVIDDFGHHPAVMGLYLTDEPGAEVSWNGLSPRPSGKVEEFHGDLGCWRGVRSVRVGDWLASGQMMMWKVVTV